MNTSPIANRIKLLANSMKLASFKDYEETLRDSLTHQKGHEEFLILLLEQEAISRKLNKLQRLKRSAKFPYDKTLDDFEVDRLEHVEESTIYELCNCDFINRKENIIMIGNPGTR